MLLSKSGFGQPFSQLLVRQGRDETYAQLCAGYPDDRCHLGTRFFAKPDLIAPPESFGRDKVCSRLGDVQHVSATLLSLEAETGERERLQPRCLSPLIRTRPARSLTF
jgi:hypothetical protein